MNERKRGYRKDPVNCQVCGKLIPNAYASRKYCDDCRKKIRRRYDGKHHEDHQKAYEVVINELKTELEPEPIFPIRPHKTIREIVIEAEKEGLTYGKYVAKYHL